MDSLSLQQYTVLAILSFIAFCISCYFYFRKHGTDKFKEVIRNPTQKIILLFICVLFFFTTAYLDVLLLNTDTSLSPFFFIIVQIIVVGVTHYQAMKKRRYVDQIRKEQASKSVEKRFNQMQKNDLARY